MSEAKRCCNCFETKPVAEFYKRRSRIGPYSYEGYQPRCKACNNEVCFVYRNRKRPKKIEKYFEEREWA